MILNQMKSKSIFFNFIKNYQFTTRLHENEENIEVVSEIKLLGTILTDDLKWDKNTSFLRKKAYRRMKLLYNAAKFTRSKTI